MKSLKNFKSFKLSKSEELMIKGGEVAYCTNGVDASCYYYADDAIRACARSISCKSVQVLFI